MAQFLPNEPTNASGFAMMEAIAATFILMLAFLGTLALTRRKIHTQTESKYMTRASALASEKLEDLSIWGPNDPNACLPPGAKSVGSVTKDVTQAITCPGGATDVVSYFDDVTMGAADSVYSETIRITSVPTFVYVTTAHAADGSISISTSDTPPSDTPTFHRRWIIERNSQAGSARRITVLVTLLDRRVQPPVAVKMTM
jgi:hypothetical protein